MYTSLAGLVEGWSKNVYVGGRRSYPDEPVLRALIPVMFCVRRAVLAAPAGGAAAGARRDRCLHCLGPAAVATGLSALFWVTVRRGFGINPLYGLTYPLGV